MPEGDTVYRTATVLTEALADKVLTRGELRHPRLSTVDLAGRTVVGVRTVGKHLFVRFDRNLSLHNHLGLDGAWHVYPLGGRRWRRPAHQVRAILTTPEDQAIGFTLHEMALLPTDEESRLVGHLGPDLLDPQWDRAEALRRLRSDGDREIGLALLDQRVVAGVGNVIKAEVCFMLGVSPWTPVSEVDTERAVDLSHTVLDDNKMRPDRRTTGDPRRGRGLWVYGRTRSGCLRCGGRIHVGAQGIGVRERIAYFCPRCQPGPITSRRFRTTS
ncbi:MAG: DNA glycosylase [Actinomycetota bacterium]|nr:DNA glycosylase [Actinomycetota bacterium]